MPRVDTIRSEVQRLVRAQPFQPFALVLENGERLVIGHPENIAFEPSGPDGTGGSEEFYVLTKRLRHFCHFDAVTSVALLDRSQVN